MRVLVFGTTGQLGWEVLRRGNAASVTVNGVARSEADITNRKSVSQIIDRTPSDVVINAAAYTNVDQAETDSETAMAVNCDGPGFLAEACANKDLPLIHVSTDYVFNGQSSRPYREDDPIDPLGVYGQSKARGESRVRNRLDRHVIIRTSWLYGVHGRNFVKTMLRLGAERQVISVVNDQTGCPTFAGDLAQAIIRAAIVIHQGGQGLFGTYHFCNLGQVTWYGFAEAIFELVRGRIPLTVERVQAITSDQYPTPVRRPAYSVLDTTKFTSAFGYAPPHWRDSLATMLEETLVSKSYQ